MSTKASSQEIVNVEVKLPPIRMATQVILNVEVEIAYRTVTFGPRVQAS